MSEAKIIIDGGRVTKLYASSYYRANEQYGRTPEPEWYRRRLIPQMPEVLEYLEEDGGIVLPFLGLPVRQGRVLLPGASAERVQALIDWLIGVQASLNEAGVFHRDLHGNNILDDGENFWLIDWSWASYQEDAPKAPHLPRDGNVIGNMLRHLRRRLEG